MDARAVRELRASEQRDAALRARSDRLRELDGQVAGIRARAEAVAAFFAGYPSEKTRRQEEADAAAADLERRRAELAEAEKDVERARDEEARAHARLALSRARDHVDVGETRVARATGLRDELERDAAALTGELPVLAAEAAAVSEEVPGVEAPDGAPALLVEWASHAHAELFVALGHVDVQRERVIREANELASMLLGEPTYGSTVAQVIARIEAAAR